MSNSIRIRKGVNIRLKGSADQTLETPNQADVIAIKPTDFHGLVPKLLVKAGESVKAGDAIFYDKQNDKIKYCTPLSGTIKEIVRGEKRRILEIQISVDSTQDYKSSKTINPSSTSREDLLNHLLEGGAWPFFKQRPFDVNPDPSVAPKAIFVSGFDSSPLAPDPDFVMQGREEDFKTGLAALVTLADGKKVHLAKKSGTSFFNGMPGVQHHDVQGPHPAGNVGVQMHQIDPINKGEVAWSINPQDVANIGAYLSTGKFSPTRVFALAGTSVTAPKYYKVVLGSNLSAILNSQVAEGARIISGNVLTGTQIGNEGFLGYFDHLVSAIPEGHEAQFVLTKGWLSPGFHKFSISKSYPTWLMPKSKEFDLNTNSNGEDRAFVVSGQYEKVFPFNIYPVQLIKSIMTNNIDAMEQLGIYEVAPEDFALCEYVCTSKIQVQKVVREGLDYLKSEV